MSLTTKQLSKPFDKIAFRSKGTGEPLVLIHGVGMQSAAWDPQIDVFSKTHHVIALDLPGHGESDPLPIDSELPYFVAWLHAALLALNTGPVSLAGHSMGALVSAGFAITHPDMVSRLALLNGVFQRSKIERVAVIARAAEIRAGEFDLEIPLTRWFGDSATDKHARTKVSKWLATVNREGYAASYDAFARGDSTYADQFHKITCPLLTLTGDGDLNSSPAMAKKMARVAKNGKSVIIIGHRHMVNLTAPDQVNAALQDWLNTPVSTLCDNEETLQKAIDPLVLRNAFGAFMTGVTVVTTLDNEANPLGFTANSFASVSLDPPLVLVCIANGSRNFNAFNNAKGFAVNILSEAQIHVSNTFARPVDDRFFEIEWNIGPHGSPVFEDVSAWFDCSMFNTVEAGDHLILIGKVEAFENHAHPGLGYARGAYVTPAVEAEALSNSGNLNVFALIEHEGKVLLINDKNGQFALPETRVVKDGISSALAQLIASSGTLAEPGFIYSVYEDEARETQYISFLCQANTGSAAQGKFTELSPVTLRNIADPAVRTMLQRFADESRLGNFGVYVGNQIGGEVRPLASGS